MVQYKNILIPVDGSEASIKAFKQAVHIAERNNAALYLVAILDKKDKVISNPGGTAPRYTNGELQLMVQDGPLFKHCHDVCIDEDKNIYVCQWNAGKTYPIKLERV